jgi:sugar phosphate isomerase/epimerase
VAAFGIDRSARLIRDAGLELSGYLRAGMLTADAQRRQQVRDDNRRAIDEVEILGPCLLVVVPGGLPQYSRPGSAPSKDLATARAMVADELAELLPYARAAGVPLALEPLHPMHAAKRCINTMRQALDVCDWLAPDRKGGLGLTLDVYHVWWDPELRSQIGRAGAERLLSMMETA